MRSLNRKTPRRLLFSGIETYDTPRARFLEDETSGAPFPQEGRAALLSRPPAGPFRTETFAPFHFLFG